MAGSPSWSSLTDPSLCSILARLARRLAQPTTFALPSSWNWNCSWCRGWQVEHRQAAVTWERKHLTFEAATQYHLLCGGGRGRRLAINSLLRANSSSVLRNQTILPPRGGRLHSVHSLAHRCTPALELIGIAYESSRKTFRHAVLWLSTCSPAFSPSPLV